MAEDSDRQLAKYLLVFSFCADALALLGFAGIVLSNYFIRLGVIGLLGIAALIMSVVSMYKYFWNAFTPGRIVSQDSLGLFANAILLIIGVGLIVALWWVPQSPTDKPKDQPAIVSTTPASQTAPPSGWTDPQR